MLSIKKEGLLRDSHFATSSNKMYSYFILWLNRTTDYTINRSSVKLFKTTSIDIVAECREMLGFTLPIVQILRSQTLLVNNIRKALMGKH